jgi:holo-[acyl-carrier protein] synthase
MIVGVGTDLVAVSRLAALYARHGVRVARRILADSERRELQRRETSGAGDTGRFLAKRFAAKEAFAKAVGTGVRSPVLLTSIAVVHDALGKPEFEFSGELAQLVRQRRLRAHLSLSDEADLVVAFVILEEAA